MNYEEKMIELSKLAKVAQAARVLADAADANNVSPAELMNMVVALATKELEKIKIYEKYS